MSASDRPLVISAPEPRTLDLIFTEPQKHRLFKDYDVHETTAEAVGQLPAETLNRCRYIVGQPPLSRDLLDRMQNLRCIFNVESNLINNMPYDVLFARGIHVVTTGAVFAQPVAEIGLGFALCLVRGIIDADLAFREGRELWGGDGNAAARLLAGGRIGIIGFGDLGRALCGLLAGFRADIVVHDPWLPDSLLHDAGVTPCGLPELLESSDMVFVVAAVTSENRGFLNRDAFVRMKPGAGLILLSRADVVDFDDLMEAVASGHIVAASDVFPEEPLPADHPVRTLPGFLRSAHRAGAMDVAFKQMGDMVLDDMDLIDRDLPPIRCKRAERETVSRMRSRPVETN
ncbi:phosphoglycerate dehydrogenase-like enzyme [Aliiruegeria haliotis]|uniref:Phosphoglycerate dehydrogenase-like enzyme n=1 Tax=Aliiruegeria haliotis TaxID=1280846 RepID=A0A2T0RLR9_9RHOB|nr:hydroxyacid dehydrogenase [Aliiruegeria haliotis]PRY22118.1 phosphoglycerate dehydrogenase-like enzyme [Aliiruegeria haliotis]